MTPAELFDLSGEVALVTGASGGLGGRFARVLAAAGARVVVTARSRAKVAELGVEIGRAGGTALLVPLDVTDAASIKDAFRTADKHFGPVTILVNNAGIAHGGRTVDMTPEEWRRVLAVDLDGQFFVAQEMARRLIAAGTPGTIINIASLLGMRVEKGVAAYATAKAGLIQLTKALALDWARHGIRVNAIAPGWFPTAINETYLVGETGESIKQANPLRRFGEEHDLDGALLLLASKAGAYMPGAVIPADGGQGL